MVVFWCKNLWCLVRLYFIFLYERLLTFLHVSFDCVCSPLSTSPLFSFETGSYCVALAGSRCPRLPHLAIHIEPLDSKHLLSLIPESSWLGNFSGSGEKFKSLEVFI